MTPVSAEQFLADQFPIRLRPLIPTTLKTAYAAAQSLIDGEPILQVESAQAGRVISWATDLAFQRLITTNQLPFDFRWRDFAKPTGRYLEIRLSHSVLTISNVADPRKQPRNVVFRANARLNNEPVFDFDELRDEFEVRGEPHFLMLHGHQELNFAHLAVPHPLRKRNFIHRSPNLLMMPHEVPSDLPPVEDTDVETTISLKEEIEKWRRDNGE
jgi:hypothetical protein